MLKKDIINQLIQRLTKKYPSLTDTAIKESVDSIITTISQSLAKGDRMEIRGFGSFNLSYHPERTMRNPRTGKKTLMSSRFRLRFKPSKILVEKLN